MFLKRRCLNPYSIGIRIEHDDGRNLIGMFNSLNPYSIGIRIEPYMLPFAALSCGVLILILLEYG